MTPEEAEMSKVIRKTARATALGSLLLGGVLVQAATTLPPVQTIGHVQYLSGGIGKDESQAIEHASKNWPLTLEFAVKDKQRNDFTADVKVIVHDAKGHAALEATSAGPYLLAKLAPGHYTVDATLAGKTLHEKVVVKHGHPAKAVFMWPTGTDAARS
jgi:hypothetical protein